MSSNVVTFTPDSHLRDPGTKHVPGESGVWVLIFGDMLIFSVFFITYALHRGDDVDLYRRSQTHLNQAFGILMTFLMLSGSWFVANAVQAARAQRRALSAKLFRCGFACGLFFGIIKFFEYSGKVRHGITPSTNNFFMYYYLFTGIHLLHVVVGMVVIAVLSSYVQKGTVDARKIRNIESGALFWHVVDLLWIVLFALFYIAV